MKRTTFLVYSMVFLCIIPCTTCELIDHLPNPGPNNDTYIEMVSPSTDDVNLEALFPLRFTRGAWNALKESGFLPQLNDARLVYHLLQANELIVVANRSLKEYRNAVLSDGKNISEIAVKARQDSKHLREALTPLISVLSKMDLPVFSRENIYETD